MATDPNADVEVTRFKRAATAEAADLRVPTGVRRMSHEDWTGALYPALVELERSGRGNFGRAV